MTARIGSREVRPLDGEVLGGRWRPACWNDRLLMGEVFCPHHGAVALWVGNPAKRLMGFVIEHVDRVSAALDEMVRLDQEMGLR